MTLTFATPPMRTYTRAQVIEALSGEAYSDEAVDFLAAPFRFIADGVTVCQLNTNHRLLCPYESASYGVADNPLQAIERDRYLASKPDVTVVVFLTPIFKEDEPSVGGWRWHKWGRYVGDQNPQHEYIFDEEHIELVYVYSVYTIELPVDAERVSYADTQKALAGFDLSSLE